MQRSLNDVVAYTIARLHDALAVDVDATLVQRIAKDSLVQPEPRRMFRLRVRGSSVKGSRIDIRKAFAVAAAFAAAATAPDLYTLTLAIVVFIFEGVRSKHPVGRLHAAILLCLHIKGDQSKAELIDCVRKYAPDTTDSTLTSGLLDLESMHAVVEVDDTYRLGEYVSVDIAWPSVTQ